MELRGQIAIVTGASRGLGRHVAQRLASQGVRVAIAARNAGELEAVAREIASAGGTALAVPTDVGRRDDVVALVGRVRQEWGPVDVLVNNAGVGFIKPFADHTPEEIDQTLGANLLGTIYASHAVLPDMLGRGSGQIVNVASDLGRRPLANLAVYAAAKHAVVGFAQSLLREVKGRGVKVMTLTPGIIDTYFAGGREGSRDETWAMSPDWVAEVIVGLLQMPRHWLFDEVSLHPMQQDF